MQREKHRWLQLLSLIGIIFLGLIFRATDFSAAEETRNSITVASEKEVQVNQEFATEISFSDESEDELLIIDSDSGYQINDKKTKEENKEVIDNINIDNKKIFLKLKKFSDKHVIKISVYGSFLIEGQLKQRIYLSNSEIENQEYIWTVKNTVNSMDVGEINPTSTVESTDDFNTVKSTNASFETSDTVGKAENKKTEINTTSLTVPEGFDWTKLDSENENINLSTFTEQTENVPVKLSGGAFDKTERNYFLFFGHVGSGNTYNNDTGEFSKVGNVRAKLGEGSKTSIVSPGMIGAKKGSESVKVFGYDFNYNDSSLGSSGSNFDFGVLNDSGTEIVESNRKGTQSQYEQIMKLYTKDNEILAYGFVPRRAPASTSDANAFYLPIRVHGYVTNYSEGRIRYDISYLNESDEDKTYVGSYGLHVDIGGSHQQSELYSNGDNGLYFNQSKAVLVDGLTARIYFYLGQHNYDEKNGPIDFKVGNLNDTSPSDISTYNVGAWQKDAINKHNWISGDKPSYLNPLGEWDTPTDKDSKYNLTHPIFVYRWAPQLVKSGGVGTNSFDMSIVEPSLNGIAAEKSFVNETSSDGKNHVGDILQFKLLAKNLEGTSPWENVTISDVLPKELDIDPKTIQITDSNGKEIVLPESSYNSETREVKSEPLSISKQSTIALSFNAQINKTASGKSVINKMKAASEDNSISDEVTFDVDEGNLTFISAPEILNFGDNLKLSTKKQEYPIEEFQGDSLKIQDTRTDSAWKLTGKLLKEFTGTQGQTAENILHYRYLEQNDAIFSTKASILISENKTIDNQIVDLSQAWGNTTEGPVLVVPPGSVDADSYNAKIQWTLEDVPENN